jgi:hypothetical protein
LTRRIANGPGRATGVSPVLRAPRPAELLSMSRLSRTLLLFALLAQLALVALVALVVPASALAAAGSAVIRDCTSNGRITQHHSRRELRQALDNLPADIEEYSNCHDLIRRALLAASRGGGGSGGGGGSEGGSSTADQPAATVAEQRQLAHAKKKGRHPIRFGAQSLTPGATPLSAGGLTHALPTPLILLLAMLGAAALLGAALAIRRIVLARRTG